MRIDKNTLEDWNNRWVTLVTIELINAGCDGTEIRIHEWVYKDTYRGISIENSDITAYVSDSNKSIFENAILTKVKGKWLLKSEEVLTHCGCGKSFSLKSGNLRADKIKLLKSKLSKRPKHML